MGWIHIFEVLNIQVNRLFNGESNASNIFILLVDLGALTCCIGFYCSGCNATVMK